jgi:DNA helicase IV
VAERAADDRHWAYGHIVVDEAQELSPMTWRLLMRRCPSRSMTLVGDIAQNSSPAGAQSWASVLDPYVEGRWRLEELTVNYRTPAQIMDLAAGVLAAAGITARTPESVREGDEPPAARRVGPAGDLWAALAGLVTEELDALGGGRLAVLVPTEADVAEARDALDAALPGGSVATGGAALDVPVGVLTVRAAKGLEFDTVVLVEPARVLSASARGANDLYVGLTRPTQRLRVLFSGDLPPGLTALTPA